jgi:hypothetical protein
LNFQAARILHRHGNEWVELTPVADRSPDPRDPERQLVHGAQLYRCGDCDEEFQIAPAEGSS